jgi:RNA polymerase sigma factor for flagellar operon FliA
MKGADMVCEKNDAGLWDEYRETRSVALRNRLVEKHRGLAEDIARRVLKVSPVHADRDAISGDAYLGLISAVEGFDPGRGWKFTTYAQRRIRGAIIDGLRAMDWVPRCAREREEAAGRKVPYMLPADSVIGGHHADASQVFDNDYTGRVAIAERFADPAPGPAATAGAADSFNALLVGLEPGHRLAVTLYFAAGLNLKEAGKALGLTESSASHIVREALVSIKGRLARKGMAA